MAVGAERFCAQHGPIACSKGALPIRGRDLPSLATPVKILLAPLILAAMLPSWAGDYKNPLNPASAYSGQGFTISLEQFVKSGGTNASGVAPVYNGPNFSIPLEQFAKSAGVNARENKPTSWEAGELAQIIGTVIRNSPTGLWINCTGSGPDLARKPIGTVFLRGDYKTNVGATVNLLGAFAEYKTALLTRETVPAFDSR
jgi:hypothetical protein